MAFIGDTTPIRLQLKLTNYAESLPESKTRLHVRRISFIITILDDESSAEDVAYDFDEPLSKEHQKVLNWQARPENLQDDVEVRDTLTQLSGKLCPYKNISTSLYDKVKSEEEAQQKRVGNRPLSAYRHVSFRSAMLTKHSAGDGQDDGRPELLFQHDGLGGEQSFMRWRSHDFIKLTLCKPRPYFRVFWLIQWDIVDLMSLTDSVHDAINHGKRRRSPSFHQDSMKRPDDELSGKFNGVRCRHREKRKPRWVAEMRPKGTRDKLWLGSFKTAEAAARAADAAFHYYNIENRMNFRDSPQFLKEIPSVLVAEGKMEFVKKEAQKLGALAEILPSTRDPENRSCNTCTEGFSASQPLEIIGSCSNFNADGLQPETNGNFVDLPTSDGVSDFETNVDVLPSTYCTSDGLLHATVGSSPGENAWLSTPDGSFTENSHGRAGVLYPSLERTDRYQDTLTPAGNCSLEGSTNTLFNVLTNSTDPWGGNFPLAYISSDISDDIARESLSEIPSAGISNDVLRHQHEMGSQTAFRVPQEYNSSQGAISVHSEPHEDWGIDIFDRHWLFQSNDEDTRHQSQQNLPGQWCQQSGCG